MVSAWDHADAGDIAGAEGLVQAVEDARAANPEYFADWEDSPDFDWSSANERNSGESGLCRAWLEGLPNGQLFCSLPPGESPWAVVLAVAVLVWVASGVLPAVSAIPFAFVAYSVTTAGTLVDGGDQVVLVAAVLFIPYSLCDWRLFAWRPPGEEAGVIRATVARAAILTLKVQISIVYLVACIGKLATEAWTEGSALYYWTRIPAFGTPNWLEGLVYATTGNPAISVILTWGTLVLEFALGVSLLLPLRFRLNVLLPAGFFLHGAILFVMGIASFSIAMFGAVLLLLVPADSSWSLLAHRWYSSAPVRRESKEEVPHVVP